MYWDYLSQIEKEYIEFLYRGNCIKIGTFKLKSGRDSPYFIEMQESFDSVALPIIGNAYACKICGEFTPHSFDIILGPAEKGTGLAIAACLHLPSSFGKIPIVWDRKQPKDYGTQKRPSWIVGSNTQLRDLVREKKAIKVIVIDDVITTGATKKDVMNKFEQELNMLCEELKMTYKPEVKWLKMFISANRREMDEMGRNPIEVLEGELCVPIGWITDSYNIFGHLQKIGILDRKSLAKYIEYCNQYGLQEDKKRLEELCTML